MYLTFQTYHICGMFWMLPWDTINMGHIFPVKCLVYSICCGNNCLKSMLAFI